LLAAQGVQLQQCGGGLSSLLWRFDQPVFMQLLVQGYAANAKLKGGAQAVIPVLVERFTDASDLGFAPGLGQAIGIYTSWQFV
jgi:hypothetical protein